MNLRNELEKAERDAQSVVREVKAVQAGLSAKERRVLFILNRYAALRKVYEVNRVSDTRLVNGRIVFNPVIEFAHRPEGKQKRHYAALLSEGMIYAYTHLRGKIGRKAEYKTTPKGLVEFVRKELLDLVK